MSFVLIILLGLLSQYLQHLVDVLDDEVVGLLCGLLWNVEAAPRDDFVLVVVGFLGQALHVLVQRVDVVPVRDAVEGPVVEVGHLGVVFVDEVVEEVVDAQLQLVLLEQGQDPL